MFNAPSSPRPPLRQREAHGGVAPRVFLVAAHLVLLVATAACGPAGDSRGSDAQSVDSLPYIEAELAAFRGGLPPVDTLTHGSPSRDELVGRFIMALQEADTAAFAPMAMSRQEFAWLYYPHSRNVAPPYELPPDVVWMNLQNRSSRGLSRVLGRYAGEPLEGLGYECRAEPVMEGPNRFWHGCELVREVTPGDTVRERAFGSIWELNGRFKLVSFGNEY
jgi:hypothetical protein